MDNFIKINGIEIPLTQAQVEGILGTISLQKKKSTKVSLADVPVGKTFKAGKYEFIVLEHSKNTTAVILKDLLFENEEFGKDNNYQNSNVDNLCNDFANEISEIVGAENLIEHTVDLTSDDGLKDYGKIKRRMSLLTTELYRRYVDILDKHKIKKWWWLATAFSTPKHDPENWVKCVSPDGCVGGYDCINFSGGRPFSVLGSNIEVTSVE